MTRPNVFADRMRMLQATHGNDECWRWRWSHGGGGYALAYFNGRTKTAHRSAYEMLVGPIPDGLQLDHLCRVRNCVNPDHLEPVTARENTLRSENPCATNARKTHCPRGHALFGENLVLNSRGQRVCLECRRESGRRSVRLHRERQSAQASVITYRETS